MQIGWAVAGYVLSCVLFRLHDNENRSALLRGATVWGAFAVLTTEGLSLIHQLSPRGLEVVWVAADVFLLLGILRRSMSPDFSFRHHWSPHPHAVDWSDAALLWCVSLIVIVVARTALLSPPNTWDVLTYHLPRIVHWLQDRSLAFYETPETRQLSMSPGGEYLILQLHGLAGGDAFDNLIEWFSFLGSIVGVSMIAKELGAGARGQVLAAVVCSTIPQGILEASGSKNNYILALWLVLLTWYLVRFSRTQEFIDVVGIAITAGLALVTKGTAIVLIAPIAVFVTITWSRSTWLIFSRALPLVLLTVTIINAGYWLRNTASYGNPLGPPSVYKPGEYKYSNDVLTPTSIASNTIRNVALHLSAPSPALNDSVERKLVQLIRSIGADENDPRTTWSYTTFHVPDFTEYEALTGNPLHLGLICATLLIAITSTSLRRSNVVWFACALTSAFLLFCAVFRWQPWNTRLHLPLFVLWSAAIAVAFERVLPRWVTASIGFILILTALLPLLHNRLRPLTRLVPENRDRVSRYFAERPSLFEPYSAAAELVNTTGCSEIGLDIPENGFEYPLLMMLNAERDGKDIRRTDGLHENTRFRPCAVICVECVESKRRSYESNMGPSTNFDGLIVFSRSAPVAKVHSAN